MFYHFRNTTGAFPTSDGGSKLPETQEEQQALIDDLQAHKTELYKDLIAEKATPRPGVIELMVRLKLKRERRNKYMFKSD